MPKDQGYGPWYDSEQGLEIGTASLGLTYTKEEWFRMLYVLQPKYYFETTGQSRKLITIPADETADRDHVEMNLFVRPQKFHRLTEM
jgi:hypothetical protein